MPKISPAVPAKSVATQQSEAVRQLFGNYPEDVISPINSVAEALGWLEEIFLTIKQDAGEAGRNAVRIRRLADAGAYIALDYANYAGCEHESMAQRLLDAGVVDSLALASDAKKGGAA